jgi:uncharacterized protein
LSTEPTPLPLFDVLGRWLAIRGYVLMEITNDPKRLERGKQLVTASRATMRTPEHSLPVSRRSLLMGSAVVAAGAGLGIGAGRAVLGAEHDPERPRKVIDCHAHLHHRSRPTWKDDDRKLIEASDRLGIDQLCCSILTPRRPATAEGFRECNRWVVDALKRFPGRVLGYCYVNPGYTREALEEVRRCVEGSGFVGVKLYNEYRCQRPPRSFRLPSAPAQHG